MKLIWIVVTILSLFSLGGAQESAESPQSGTVCVASMADDPFRGQVIPRAGEVSSGGLHVRVDKRSSAPWPQRQSLKIDGLDLREKHLLAVLDAHSKPVESLWFRFSDFKSANLCMSYDGYQGVGLQESTRHTPWCKCK